MLKKLQSYFPNAITTYAPPPTSSQSHYWFKDNNGTMPIWFGVPRTEIKEGQLDLLCTLYERIIPNHSLTSTSREWYTFLFEEGCLPNFETDKEIRFIQFHIIRCDQEIPEVEEAIKEFFHYALDFFWLDETNGIIIEEKTKGYYEEEEVLSISITLETDFYIKPIFYLGKFRYDHNMLRKSFFHERELFFEARKFHSKERVFTFEKIFPTIMAANVPDIPSAMLDQDFMQLLREDPELRQTIEIFLEHNSNASLAAKKLHIHRNTLQYRLEKFTDKTGVHLKSFPSALTVYLACLIASTQD